MRWRNAKSCEVYFNLLTALYFQILLVWERINLIINYITILLVSIRSSLFFLPQKLVFFISSLFLT